MPLPRSGGEGVDELRGEPVEQFWVRRLLAELAEVVGRGDDAAAEMVLPKAVDDHAGRQRIIFRGDPVGEHQPPAARFGILGCGRDLRIREAEDGREAGLDLGAWGVGVAARQYVGLWRTHGAIVD